MRSTYTFLSRCSTTQSMNGSGASGSGAARRWDSGSAGAAWRWDSAAAACRSWATAIRVCTARISPARLSRYVAAGRAVAPVAGLPPELRRDDMGRFTGADHVPGQSDIFDMLGSTQ